MSAKPRLLVGALIALLLVLTGCSAATPSTPAAAPPAVQSTEHTPLTAGVDPASIDIPKIGAHSTLVALGLNPDDTVEVPPVTQPLQAGWYNLGPKPGDPGPAVVLGHVDGNKQKGIFFRLKEMAPGDPVNVTRTDGSVAKFVVRKVDQVSKKDFPTDAVYGDTTGAELRLITCGGTFDHSAKSYQDNVIVYADLA